MKQIFMITGILYSFLLIGCQQEKIPITTDSDIALEYFIKGRDLAERIRYQEAAENFRLALKHDPDFPMANYFMSVYGATPNERLAYFEKAKNDMDKATWGERQLILALEAAMGGYAKRQLDLITELAAKFPNDERAQNLLANIYFSQQDYEKAIELYNEVIKIEPEFSQAYNQLGYAYRYIGDYVRAEKAFKKYIELIPDDPNPYDSYAELLLKMGEYEISIENYEKALKIDPDFMNSYVGLSSNYNIKREYKTARKYLKEFYLRAKNADQRRTAVNALIISHVDEGDLDGAMSWAENRYKQSLEEADTVLIAGDLNMMGYLFRAKEEPIQAMQVYKESEDLIRQSGLPENIKNNFKRAYTYYDVQIALLQNDLALAEKKRLEYETTAHEMENPFQIRLAHEMAGQIAFAKGEYQSAIEQFEMANQQNAHNLYRIASAYEAMQNLEKAIEYYELAANFNGFMDLEYALIRNNSEKKAAELRSRLRAI